MNKLFLIFNHTLTEEQVKQAKEVLKVDEIVVLPEELKTFWSNIPPEVELEPEMFDNIKDFIIKNKGDGENFCLIQGDFGATVYLVTWCYKHGFVPIYATTKRLSVEMKNPDGTISLSKVFKHERFRRYIVCE